MTPSWIWRGKWGAWPFPPHHVHVGWLVAALVLPPLAYATLPLGEIALALLFAAWLSLVPSLAVVAVLDWSRVAAPKSPLSRIGRAGARLVVSSLGACGIVAGVWMAQRVIGSAWRGTLPLAGWLIGAALSLAMCILGLHLAVVPYTRVPREVDEHGGHGV